MARAPGRGRKEIEDPNNTWDNQFTVALLKKELAEAQTLLGKGAKPDHVFADPSLKLSVTPFLVVCLKGVGVLAGGHGTSAPPTGAMPMADVIETLQWLAQTANCDVNSQFSEGTVAKGTIFHYCVRNDLVELLEKLLQNRLSISENLSLAEVDSSGMSATQLAIISNKVDMARLLLKHGAYHPFNALVDHAHTQAARACVNGDVALLETLMQIGDDPHQIDRDGLPLLHLGMKHPAVVDLLLDRGVSINQQSAMIGSPFGIVNGAPVGPGGQTVLSYLATRSPKSLDLVDAFLQRGIDVNCGDGLTGLTPLMHAIQQYNGDLVKKLIFDGKSDVNVKDSFGATATHWAVAARGKALLEQLMVIEGIELNAQDNRGDTPLHRACAIQGKSDAAQVLLAKENVDVNLTNAKCNTALHTAVLHDNVAALKVLTTARCPVNSPEAQAALAAPVVANPKDAKKPGGKKGAAATEQKPVLILNMETENRDGKTPLQIAIAKNRTECAEVLINQGHAVVHRSSKHGNLLHHAVVHGNEALVALLLTKGADVHCRNDDDRTPLHLAALYGHTAIVSALLAAGAAADEQDALALDTPLTLATRHKRVDIMEILVGPAGQANVAIADKVLRTALHIACENAHQESIELLLQNGASPVCFDSDQRTPLHLAASMNCHEEIFPLLSCGAPLWAKDKANRSPLHLAVMAGALETVATICDILEEHQKGDYDPTTRAQFNHYTKKINEQQDDVEDTKHEVLDAPAPVTHDAAHPDQGGDGSRRQSQAQSSVPGTSRTATTTADVPRASTDEAANEVEDPVAERPRRPPPKRIMKHPRPKGPAAEASSKAVDGAAARASYFRQVAAREAQADWESALSTKDETGRYPLLLAAQAGHSDIAKLLVRTHTNLQGLN